MINLLYIASPSYSGSTLLTFLLNAHPAIGTIGELKWGEIDLANYQCSCGALLRECSFWKAVARKMRARDLPFDLQRPSTEFRVRDNHLADRIARARIRGKPFETLRAGALAALPACRRAWPRIAAVNRGLIDIILELQNATVFVDASKDPVRLRHLLDTGDYHLSVIQLVRDGRGVINSGMRHAETTAAFETAEWHRTHREIDRLAERIGRDNSHRLRYEDLCAAPAESMERIYRFAGLPPVNWTANYRSTAHHILGNSMRLRDTTALRLDEKWRTMLSQADLATFERNAGQLNRSYGYS